MTGAEMRDIRNQFGLGRLKFALLLGYTRTDRNNHYRVRKMEAEDLVPLVIGRYVWLIKEHFQRTGKLPQWPDHLRLLGEEGQPEPWM